MANAKPKAAAKPKPKAAAKPKPKAPAKLKPKVAAKRKTNTGRTTRKGRTGRTPKPKGLEASYSGKIFRSQLEARWALYLDLLGIDWDYEPCFYKLSPTLYYLPDFYLPRLKIWVEVKGAPFFDAESYAKATNSVAGKNPLPTRDAPYSPTQMLILGGVFTKLKPGQHPRHTAVTKLEHGIAGFNATTLNITSEGIRVHLGEIIDKAAATGTKAARRPSPIKTKKLLEPAPAEGTADPLIMNAYNHAAAATFHEGVLQIPPGAAAQVSRRRSGRHLPEGL